MTRIDIQHCSALKGEAVKMMAQCQIALSGRPGMVVNIHRGMCVIDHAGEEIGKVAAVALGAGGQQAACLILGHLPEKEQYQSLPITWIDRVDSEVIYLNVRSDEVRSLPDWHPG